MNRKNISISLAVLVLIIFTFPKMLSMSGILIAFKNFNIFKGLIGSPFVGLNNFVFFFTSPFATRIFENTFILQFSSLIITCLLAYLFIFCITRFKNNFLKYLAISIITIPFFIPIISYITTVSNIFGSYRNTIFTDPNQARIFYILTDSLRYIWIPVIIGTLICTYTKNNSAKNILWFVGIIALFKVPFLMSSNVESLLLLYNNKVVSTIDTVDTYLHQTFTLVGDISGTSVVNVLKSIVQIIFAIIGFVSLYFFIKKRQFKENILNNPIDDTVSNVPVSAPLKRFDYKNNPYLYYSIFLVLAIFPILITYKTFFSTSINYGGLNLLFANPLMIRSMFNSLCYGIISGLLCGFTTLILAYPLFYNKKSYLITLLIFAFLPYNFVGEYVIYMSFGLSNTVFPIILYNSISITSALVLYFVISTSFEKDYIPSPIEYLKRSLYPVLLIGLAFFAISYGDFFNQLMYIKDKNLCGIGRIGKEIISMNNMINALAAKNGKSIEENLLPVYNSIVSIIPVIFGMLSIVLGGIFLNKTKKER